MKKACGIIIVLLALVVFVGCDQNMGNGFLKLYLSDNVLDSLSNNQSINITITSENATSVVNKRITLSKNNSSKTIELPIGTYSLSVDNDSFDIASSVYITSNKTVSVSVNPLAGGKIKVSISPNVKTFLANNKETVLDFYFRKDVLEVDPSKRISFSNNSLNEKSFSLEKGTYYISHDFSLYSNNEIREKNLQYPRELSIDIGESYNVYIDANPEGDVFLQITNPQESSRSFFIEFYSDSEMTDLKKKFYYGTENINNTINIDTGKYYIKCKDSLGDFVFLDTSEITVSADIPTYIKATYRENMGSIYINYNVLNKPYDDRIASVNGLSLKFTNDDSDYSNIYDNNEGGCFHLPSGTYSVELINNPIKTGVNAVCNDSEIYFKPGMFNYDKSLQVVCELVGNVQTQLVGEYNENVKLLFTSKDSDSKTYEVTPSKIKSDNIMLIGKYDVSASLTSSDEYLDVKIPYDTINLTQAKNIDFTTEVFKCGKLNINLPNDFYEQLHKLEVLVHLYKNGELYCDKIIDSEFKDNPYWLLPEGNYSYELEYDKDMMNLSFEIKKFTISYQNDVDLGTPTYGFNQHLSVDIQNKIPNASNIDYIFDFKNDTFKVKNYPKGAEIKWYLLTNDGNKSLIHTGNTLVWNRSTMGYEYSCLQVRVYYNDMLIDVQQIGNLANN